MKNPYTLYLTILFLCLMPSFISAQDVDIVPYLRQIESGEKNEVLEKFPELKKEYPNSPSVMFLEGVLTENGQDAVSIYSRIVNTYPYSKYADAALYRIYSYYFALGLYDTARGNLNRLKKDYPQSPYIKIADRNIPSEDEYKIPEQTEKKEEKETGKTGYNFTIQAGAFSQMSNALTLKKDFEDSAFYTDITEKVVGGTTFHVVYVGRFNTEEEAKNFLQVINKEYNLDGRVVKIE